MKGIVFYREVVVRIDLREEDEVAGNIQKLINDDTVIYISDLGLVLYQFGPDEIQVSKNIGMIDNMERLGEVSIDPQIEAMLKIHIESKNALEKFFKQEKPFCTMLFPE